MLEMSLILAENDPMYEEVAFKFVQHFMGDVEHFPGDITELATARQRCIERQCGHRIS